MILKKQVDKDEQVQEENKFRVIDIKNEAPDFIKRKYFEIGAGNGNGDITNLFTINTLYPFAGSNTLGFNKTFWMSNETNPDLELLYNPTDNETQLFLSFQITNGDTNVVSKKYSVESVVDDNGEEQEINKSTTTLTTKEFSLLMNDVLFWSNNTLNINLPNNE